MIGKNINSVKNYFPNSGQNLVSCRVCGFSFPPLCSFPGKDNQYEYIHVHCGKLEYGEKNQLKKRWEIIGFNQTFQRYDKINQETLEKALETARFALNPSSGFNKIFFVKEIEEILLTLNVSQADLIPNDLNPNKNDKPSKSKENTTRKRQIWKPNTSNQSTPKKAKTAHVKSKKAPISNSSKSLASELQVKSNRKINEFSMNPSFEAYFGVKVPKGTKGGQELTLSLPNGKILGFLFPSSLVPNGTETLTDQIILVIPPGSTFGNNVNDRSKNEVKKRENNYIEKIAETKKCSRVGRAYQARALPKALANYSSTKSERELYDQVWNPDKANAENAASNDIEDFLKSVSDSPDIAMRALHNAGYDPKLAQNFLLKVFDEPKKIPCSQESLAQFHRIMTENYKCFRTAAKGMNTTPMSCLIYYYQKYKQTEEYQMLKMFLRARKDECEICGREGELLCCDGCNKPYHLHCLDPPLRKVPCGDWFCDLCKRLGKKKQNLHIDFTNYSQNKR